MPPSKGSYPSSRPRTTRIFVEEYETIVIEPTRNETIVIEPARKPFPKTKSTTRVSTITLEKGYKTNTAKPPKQPRATDQWTEKSGSSKSQTKAPTEPQPPEVKTSLDIIQIPCNSSPIRIFTVPLVGIGRGGVPSDDCVPIEQWLLEFPDMRFAQRLHRFHYPDRQLLGLRAPDMEDLGALRKTNQLIYVCYDPKAGLPHNGRLEELSGVKVYGDGFWFMMYKDFDVHEGPRFIDMRPEMVEDLESGGVAETVMRRLLAGLET